MWEGQTDVVDNTVKRLGHLRHILYIDPAALDCDVAIKCRWHIWSPREVR